MSPSPLSVDPSPWRWSSSFFSAFFPRRIGRRCSFRPDTPPRWTGWPCPATNESWSPGESFGLLKVWDVASTREIRTIKAEIGVNNVYFIDNERFIVLMGDRADVYSSSGTVIDKIKVP